MDINWKDGEFLYCRDLVYNQGDEKVGRDPKNIATYLRLQASESFRAGEYELSARLSQAATCINEDARNNHKPDWTRAQNAMEPNRIPAESSSNVDVDVDFFETGNDPEGSHPAGMTYCVCWATGARLYTDNEDAAAEVQRLWRKAVGMDPMTGEPNRTAVPAKYNHAYTIAFVVAGSNHPGALDVTADRMRQAIKDHIAGLSDDDLLAGAGLPFNTIKE